MKIFSAAVLLLFTGLAWSKTPPYDKIVRHYLQVLNLGSCITVEDTISHGTEVLAHACPELKDILAQRPDFGLDTGHCDFMHQGSEICYRLKVNPSVHIILFNRHVEIHIDRWAYWPGDKIRAFKHVIVEVAWPYFERHYLFRPGARTSQKFLVNHFAVWKKDYCARYSAVGNCASTP